MKLQGCVRKFSTPCRRLYVECKRGGPSLLRVSLVVLCCVLGCGLMGNAYADSVIYLVNAKPVNYMGPFVFEIFRMNPKTQQTTRIYSEYFTRRNIDSLLLHREKKLALIIGAPTLIPGNPTEKRLPEFVDKGWLWLYDFKQEKFLTKYCLRENAYVSNYFYNTSDEKLGALITKLKTDTFYTYDFESKSLGTLKYSEVAWGDIVYQDTAPQAYAYQFIRFHINKETGELNRRTYHFMNPMGIFLSQEMLAHHKALTKDGEWITGHKDMRSTEDGRILSQTDTQSFMELLIYNPEHKTPQRYFVLFDKVKKTWKPLSFPVDFNYSGVMRLADYWVVFPVNSDSEHFNPERAVYRFITSDGEKMSTWTTQGNTEVLLLTENDKILFRQKDSLYRCPFIDGKVVEDQKQCCVEANWVKHVHWAIESPRPENPTPAQKTIYPVKGREYRWWE